jgi:hypothetical protein
MPKVTLRFGVLKFDKSRDVKEIQLPNIFWNETILVVSKFDKSIDFNE